MECVGVKDENKNYEIREAVYGIITNDEGKIAIISIDNWGYNLPGGKIEPNEDQIEALIREVEEEIGYDISEIKYYKSLKSYYAVSVLDKEIDTDGTAHFYTAKIATANNKKIENSHHLVWMSIDEIVGKMYFEYHNVILAAIDDILS